MSTGSGDCKESICKGRRQRQFIGRAYFRFCREFSRLTDPIGNGCFYQFSIDILGSINP